MTDKYVVVTGGGTGGHLSVAKSFIEQLYLLDYKVIFIGSTKGADKAWFGNDSKLFKTYFFDTKGVVNQNFFGKINSLFKILKATVQIIGIYHKYKVSKVISVGGFSAAPAAFATIFTKTDFYIHEQNSIMGKLNSITSKFAKNVFSSYDPNSLVKDYPINSVFFEHQRVRDTIKTIIFLGGSQGATAINNFAMEIALYLKEQNINIIHQTGKNDFEKLKDFYKQSNIDAVVFDFSTDILKYMDKADFAISRSGASTLWELSAIGLPALFIPYPFAAANHQYYNAKFLLNQNLCFLSTEKDLDISLIKDILNKDIKPISEKLILTIKKDGAKKIISKILD